VAAGYLLAAPQVPQGELALAETALPPEVGPTDGEMVLYDPGAVRIEYYRYRGAKIPTPWAQGRFQRDPQQMLERLQTLITT
jgi:hypothetical protein